MKWAAAGLCGYETAAICTRRVPTLTTLSRRHPWLGPLLVVALAVHLHRDQARSDSWGKRQADGWGRA